MQKRYVKDRVFLIMVCILSSIIAIPLLSIVWKVVSNGYKQISLEFFTQNIPNSWEAGLALQNGDIIPGGIAPGITGSLFMVAIASLMAIPLGITIGVYLSENPNNKYASLVRFISDLLQGVPSIVIGLITYSWVVTTLKSYSALAASVALTIMMLPMIIRSTEETLKMLPNSLKESALALGASRVKTTFFVIIPSAFSGIFTGILLSVSRVIGETAPLLLTSLGSSSINWNIFSPTSSIPTLIWDFYNDPNLLNMVWSSSLILLTIVFILNYIAKTVSQSRNN